MSSVTWSAGDLFPALKGEDCAHVLGNWKEGGEEVHWKREGLWREHQS